MTRHRMKSSTDQILKPGVNCSGIHDVDSTGLLIDACDYYRAFYHTARKAEHSILIAGWQFDSEVRLLRGEEERVAGEDVRLLPFLESMCNRSPSLAIYILAWDFSMIFSLEREWFQKWIFHWTTNKRIHFRFDNRHAVGATHHQKFVVIDGAVAFVGGIDICSDRWDDRRHLLENPDRVNSDGTAYDPYHDIQTYHTGPVVDELTELFRQRWRNSGGGPLYLEPAPPAPPALPFKAAGAIPIATGKVALSQTMARHLQRAEVPLLQIRKLFTDAILAAERIIYLENQYFSSQAVYWSLVARMTAPDRNKLQIIMVFPGKLPFKDSLWLGVPQMKMLQALQNIAARTGHDLGVYCTACLGGGEQRMVFIHSKLLLIDDRFITVGSANTTNRSMGLDTELNVTWEACLHDREVVRSMRRIRASLLAEHTGLYQWKERRKLMRVRGLVAILDEIADNPSNRLCRYAMDQLAENGNSWLETLEPISGIGDPEQPLMEELVFEYLSDKDTSLFARGILLLSNLFTAI